MTASALPTNSSTTGSSITAPVVGGIGGLVALVLVIAFIVWFRKRTGEAAEKMQKKDSALQQYDGRESSDGSVESGFLVSGRVDRVMYEEPEEDLGIMDKVKGLVSRLSKKLTKSREKTASSRVLFTPVSSSSTSSADSSVVELSAVASPQAPQHPIQQQQQLPYGHAAHTSSAVVPVQQPIYDYVLYNQSNTSHPPMLAHYPQPQQSVWGFQQSPVIAVQAPAPPPPSDALPTIVTEQRDNKNELNLEPQPTKEATTIEGVSRRLTVSSQKSDSSNFAKRLRYKSGVHSLFDLESERGTIERIATKKKRMDHFSIYSTAESRVESDGESLSSKSSV
ncbi:UNVERIFIED_CONTAM: hypothetical protein HDU68_006903 [Siphonaria sp. JEL0065]|nr:hypothetical protein HDU68_006903 [Siphonaria sp. JEL0065]